MGTEINEDRLKSALKVTEKEGPLSSQDKLWTETAARYNSGEGLPKKYADRPKSAITKSMVYQAVRRLKIAVKTQKQKTGRPEGAAPPNGTEAMKGILEYLESEAVRDHWKAANKAGWESLNLARKSLGKSHVDPIDNPTTSHFQ